MLSGAGQRAVALVNAAQEFGVRVEVWLKHRYMDVWLKSFLE